MLADLQVKFSSSPPLVFAAKRELTGAGTSFGLSQSGENSPFSQRAQRSPAFTLIELILVMAILTVAVAITAPTLSNFFHGRSLDSEARRLLSLTRQGQSRAVSEGIPMDLWFDVQQKKVGLEAEPSYESQDSRAESYTLQTELQVDSAPGSVLGNSSGTPGRFGTGISGASTPREMSNHPNLPRIRFLPDGYVSESSPQRVRLTSADGVALYLVQSTNRLNYEIRSQLN